MGDVLVRCSKFMSLVLRHQPSAADLELDSQGWALVDDLVAGAQKAGVPLDRERLEHIVETNSKKRFALSEDKQRIRAHQGHSVEVELALEPVPPPDALFHGTATRFLDAILKEGLVRQKRHHVHLSPDVETASAVGKRHGRLVILAIDTQKMAQDGHTFFVTENGVWLTDHVPPEYLSKL